GSKSWEEAYGAAGNNPGKSSRPVCSKYREDGSGHDEGNGLRQGLNLTSEALRSLAFSISRVVGRATSRHPGRAKRDPGSQADKGRPQSLPDPGSAERHFAPRRVRDDAVDWNIIPGEPSSTPSSRTSEARFGIASGEGAPTIPTRSRICGAA